MKAKQIIFGTLLAVLAVCGSAFAHHGAAAYDMSKPVELQGAVVTKYSWMNPHVLIYFDLKDNTGKVTQWTVEAGSPSEAVSCAKEAIKVIHLQSSG